ncbi:hypothetical protein TGAMA5MH_07861 [Trichoderma gamsii]|uniref:Uncharacterized protein n=1 Tax=Trichoderma gamsii TaxID=398673 RepID=A0A2K0T3W2_9HYPO|nr:hypothetical protein TGAMA5MH_07861 [Trichoderma gamsii]
MPLPITQSSAPPNIVVACQEPERQSLVPVVQRTEPTNEAEESLQDAEAVVPHEDGKDSDSDSSCTLSFWGSDRCNARDTPCTSECTSDTSSSGDSDDDDDSSDTDDSSDNDSSSDDDSSSEGDSSTEDVSSSDDDSSTDDVGSSEDVSSSENVSSIDEMDAMDLDEDMELGEADMDLSDGTSMPDVMEMEPREENPLVQAAGSGQAANASATTPSAAQLQQSYHYPSQAASQPQTLSGRRCPVHGTQTPRCLICDIEFWRVQCLISGYDIGRIPPPPLPINPTPLHQPSASSIAQSQFPTRNAANSQIGFQGMPPNFPGGFGFGQQQGGGGGGGGGGNSGDWGNPHGAKRPRPE